MPFIAAHLTLADPAPAKSTLVCQKPLLNKVTAGFNSCPFPLWPTHQFNTKSNLEHLVKVDQET